MTEIDITSLFNHAGLHQFSASQNEVGADAARQTYNNAVEAYSTYPLLTTDEDREAVREHLGEYGAWSDSEIEAWSNEELNGIFIQLVSGDIREAFSLTDCDEASDFDWEAYKELTEASQVSGSLFEADGKIYYQI